MPTTLTRRTIHPQIRVLDEKNGLVEYIASNETMDSYQEVIMAEGWRFTDFQKNSPFVDSHNYGTVENLLGRVVDFRIEDRNLVETVKWAIDVPQNTLAQLGFNMTVAGYLKAVSVGFMPVRVATPYDSDKSEWNAALKDLGMEDGDGIRVIYLEQEQKELSACVIGANPDAVARAHSDGIVSERDMEKLWPSLQRRSSKTYSFPTAKTTPTNEPPMSKASFIEKLSARTSSTKTAEEKLLVARKGQSESDYLGALAGYNRAVAAYKRQTALGLVQLLLADPSVRLQASALIKRLAGGRLTEAEHEAARSNMEMRALTEADTLGQGTVPIAVASIILSLTEVTGVYNTLGVITMPAGTTKFARVNSLPKAQFFMPTGQPSVMTPDTTLAGDALSGKANGIGVLIEISEELLADQSADATAAFLLKCADAIAGRIDYASFSGTGANDGDNGGQTGIFPTGAVTNDAAAAGHTAIATLTRPDFLNLIGSVNPKAIQRGGRFWTHPAFIPSLMLLKDGNNFLVQTPMENESGEWSLVGFPLSLTVAAPSATAAGSQVCAFGHGPAYNVGIRQELEIMSGSPKLQQALRSIRVLMRGRCDMADPTWFAILKTALV
ncbi:MAG: peptidase phage prohead [Pedosphaera sp.]|nr:peptidase phage prohead [Pedosphaera sp.]